MLPGFITASIRGNCSTGNITYLYMCNLSLGIPHTTQLMIPYEQLPRMEAAIMSHSERVRNTMYS